MATLTDPDGAYIGLTDFLNEGTFAWVDGTAVCKNLFSFEKLTWIGELLHSLYWAVYRFIRRAPII